MRERADLILEILQDIQGRLDSIEHALNSHGRQFVAVRAQLSGLQADVNNLFNNYERMEGRVGNIQHGRRMIDEKV
ncbi:MAG: hypothetical protein AAF677_10540 [Pseudomonadota bacterium]